MVGGSGGSEWGRGPYMQDDLNLLTSALGVSLYRHLVLCGMKGNLALSPAR